MIENTCFKTCGNPLQLLSRTVRMDDYCVILRPCWNITFDNINRTEKLQDRTASETKN